ncbi:MAG: DCC1-like thiol-disulfide oxidoreductase family protein [Chitinophagales bacterium]|nr:DCC1-like thiol-disulfide oxidoreductase family protein [Chitinophagales bacterium]
MSDNQKPLILFDGVCNLCNGFVQFVIVRDPEAKFMFTSLQSDEGQKILSAHHLPAKHFKTIILIKDEKIFTRSDAVLQIAKDLKGWKWLYITRFVPAFIRNGVYNFVSEYRYKVFGERESCMLPTKELRGRFL